MPSSSEAHIQVVLPVLKSTEVLLSVIEVPELYVHVGLEGFLVF